MTIYRIASVCIGIVLPALIAAQENLILNPDVEEDFRNQPKSWITIGSIDFYRNRSLKTNNTGSSTEPEYPVLCSGQNYLGIRAFPQGTEVAVCRFSSPLEKGQWYRISCRAHAPVSANDCQNTLAGITVYPSDSLPGVRLWYGAQPLVPYLLLTPSGEAGELSAERWTEVSAHYKAKGGEKVLWIGHFLDSAAYFSPANPWTGHATGKEWLTCKAHVFADAFAVEKCLPPGIQQLTIRNITFDSGSSEIAAVTDDNMEMLATYLNDNPAVRIRVDGHTDSDGGLSYNLDLSQKRAVAVKKWLVVRGVNPARIATAGHGKSQPLGPESTPEQKALNRRVEISFL